MESVQTFGRKKTAVAVAYCKKGRGLIKINGTPLELAEPELLRFKVYEPILLLGRERFAEVDIRIRVKGGGYTAQIYAIRQAIAKAIVAYNQKYVDEASKREIKEMELRMGVVSHTLMQAKIRSRHHRDKRIEHRMQGHRRGDVDAPDEDADFAADGEFD